MGRRDIVARVMNVLWLTGWMILGMYLADQVMAGSSW